MNMVVTNLRIDKDSYRLMKMMASEEGVSVNEYLNKIISEEIVRKPLGAKKKAKKIDPYKLLLGFAEEKYESKPMGLSALDEEIYG